MRRILSSRTGLLSLIACALIFVSGCRKLSGTYEGSNPLGMTISINFKSSDKADVTMPVIGTKEASYQVDGKTVTLHSPEGATGDMVLTINDDGSLQDSAGMIKLTKK